MKLPINLPIQNFIVNGSVVRNLVDPAQSFEDMDIIVYSKADLINIISFFGKPDFRYKYIFKYNTSIPLTIVFIPKELVFSYIYEFPINVEHAYLADGQLYNTEGIIEKKAKIIPSGNFMVKLAIEQSIRKLLFKGYTFTNQGNSVEELMLCQANLSIAPTEGDIALRDYRIAGSFTDEELGIK